MHIKRFLMAAACGSLFLASASAQVVVKDAWVRATVPQQQATGAFMQLTAAQDSRLVSVSSSAVPIVEVHEMTMDGGVMKMRAIASLPLPAGKTVALKPGGYHVMLMGLKQPMKAGDVLPLSLVVENAAGQRETIEVKAEVRAVGAAAAKPEEHKH
ncbi:MAG: copper chaperone PCu(A)C [Burkholderiales bacterium]|nr:MAG: copper chaperone PCu(A)C [Burkholderiales bacterium]